MEISLIDFFPPKIGAVNLLLWKKSYILLTFLKWYILPHFTLSVQLCYLIITSLNETFRCFVLSVLYLFYILFCFSLFFFSKVFFIIVFLVCGVWCLSFDICSIFAWIFQHMIDLLRTRIAYAMIFDCKSWFVFRSSVRTVLLKL